MGHALPTLLTTGASGTVGRPLTATAAEGERQQVIPQLNAVYILSPQE